MRRWTSFRRRFCCLSISCAACYTVRISSWQAESSLRQILLYPAKNFLDRRSAVTPGALSQGATREEAILNIREAIALVEQIMPESGDRIPEERLEAELVTI